MLEESENAVSRSPGVPLGAARAGFPCAALLLLGGADLWAAAPAATVPAQTGVEAEQPGFLERFLRDSKPGEESLWRAQLLQASSQDPGPLVGALAQTYSIFASTNRQSREWQRDMLVAAIAHSRSGRLHNWIVGALDCPDRERRSAGMHLLGAAGAASDLQLFFRDLERDDTATWMAQLFEVELARFLGRFPETFGAAASFAPRLEAPWSASLVRAAAASERPEALGLLLRALEYPSYPPALVLAELSRVVPRAPLWVAPQVEQASAFWIQNEDPAICQAAIQVAGRIKSARAVPVLIELLEHPHAGVKSSAHWALTQISGLALQPTAQRWQAWWDMELQWLESFQASLEVQLDLDDAASTLAALRQCGAHELMARELAGVWSSALQAREPQVRRSALVQVRRSRAFDAVDGMLICVEDPEPSVAQQAQEILAEFTGHAGPSDRSGWEGLLARQRKALLVP